LGDDEAAIDEAFGEVEAAAEADIFRQGKQHPVEHPRPPPRLVAAVAGLIRRVALREIMPGRTGLENPEDAVQDIPWVAPRPSPPVGPQSGRGQERFEHGPLVIGEVHEPPPGPRALEL
jgi:hypothetical protein